MLSPLGQLTRNSWEMPGGWSGARLDLGGFWDHQYERIQGVTWVALGYRRFWESGTLERQSLAPRPPHRRFSVTMSHWEKGHHTHLWTQLCIQCNRIEPEQNIPNSKKHTHTFFRTLKRPFSHPFPPLCNSHLPISHLTVLWSSLSASAPSLPPASFR